MFSIYSQLQTDGLHSRFNIRKLNPWISPMKDCGYGSFRTKWSVHSEGSRSAAATTRLHLNSLTNIMKSSSWPDSNFLLRTPVNSTFQVRFAWPWVSAACLDFNITFVLRVEEPARLFDVATSLCSLPAISCSHAAWNSLRPPLPEIAFTMDRCSRLPLYFPPVIPSSKQLQRRSSWHHKERETR